MKSRSLMTAALTMLLTVAAHPAAASQTWTVKGRVMVNHLLPELKQGFGDANPLAGITVKLSARSKIPFGWGTWNSWGQQKTGSDGRFSFSETHGGDRRQFKVTILFDSNRLRIKEGQETSVKLDSQGFPIEIHFDLTDKDWHEIHNDKNAGFEDGRKAGVIDLGNLHVTAEVPRKHADIWSLYNKVFDLFASYGSGYAFQDKVVIKYPMGIGNNASATASYANPFTNHVYIKETHFNSNAFLHELMHVWEYERSTGEDAMAWQLAKHQDTHQSRENTTFVPFYEAFAEWATYKILREMTDDKLKNFIEASGFEHPHLPLNRAYVGSVLTASERLLANVDYTERGWHSLFNILSYSVLDRSDFNQPASERYATNRFRLCEEARLGYSLKEILGIFLKHPAQGIGAYLRTREMNVADFLSRADLVLVGLDGEKVRQVKSYLDPNSTTNPRDYYCTPAAAPKTAPGKQVELTSGTRVQTRIPVRP